jgi:predicted ATP-grasp superfamily ATP-dependent carboligase
MARAIIRALISDITSYKAAVVARFLKATYPQVEIIACDHRRTARFIRTKYARRVHILPCGPEGGASYAQALADVLNRENIDLLIPVNSKEIRVLAEHRELLGSAFATFGGLELYRQLDDKIRFAALLEQTNLPHPRHYPDLNAPAPLVVKPTRSSSAHGVRYLMTDADITACVQDIGIAPKEHVIQEYVQGEGIGYSGYFDNGNILKGFAHRRLAEYPVTGGSSVIRENYPYDDLPILENLVQQLLRHAPWTGFAMFEFKRSGAGDFRFIECNPRIWGSIHQGLANGVNYFEPLLGPCDLIEKHSPTRTRLCPLDVLSLIGYARAGEWQKFRANVSAFLSAKADVSPFRDPLGFLALLMRGA